MRSIPMCEFFCRLLIALWATQDEVDFQGSRGDIQGWPRPDPTEAHEVLRRTPPVKLHVLHAGISFLK